MSHTERPLRGMSAGDLSEAARRCRDARMRGAILAIASVHDGMSLADAARIWGVDAATLRDVMRRFEESGLDGL